MTDLWEDARLTIVANRDQALDLESEMIVVPAKIAFDAFDQVKYDADVLLVFKGQCEAALEALEHGLTDAPEGILRDALAALPERLR